MIVPLSDTDCEVAGAATFTFRVAVFVVGLPLFGENVTLTVQLAPAAKLVPQVVVLVN
jgi:hypothetical protein